MPRARHSGDGLFADRTRPHPRQPHAQALAEARGCSAAQIALAWVLRQDGVLTIPKATDPAHVRENRAALDISSERRGMYGIGRSLPAAAQSRAFGYALGAGKLGKPRISLLWGTPKL